MEEKRYTLKQVESASKISKRTLERYKQKGIIENHKEFSLYGETTMVTEEDVRAAVQQYNIGRIGKDRIDFDNVMVELKRLDSEERGEQPKAPIEVYDEVELNDFIKLKKEHEDLEREYDETKWQLGESLNKITELEQAKESVTKELQAGEEEREKLKNEKAEAERIAKEKEAEAEKERNEKEEIRKQLEQRNKDMNAVIEYEHLNPFKKLFTKKPDILK